MIDNIGYGQNRLKNTVEKEARKEEEKTTEQKEQPKYETNLIPQEHERALTGAYKIFKIPGIQKADIDSYADRSKPHIKALIKDQLKKMLSTQVIMIL